MDNKPTKKSNLNERSSVTNSKVWNQEQQKNTVIIDTGDNFQFDQRIANDYPNGQVFTLRDNENTFTDVRLSDGKFYKTSATYSEI